MVNIVEEDPRVAYGIDDSAEANQKCDDCSRSGTSAENCAMSYRGVENSVSKQISYMWRDKVRVVSRRRNWGDERLREEAARWVGYDPTRYSEPFKGRSRDFKAVIAAVKFKQVILKRTSRTKCLMKEAILANTMKRAEEDLLIRERRRQLRRAQAVAEARALKEANSCENNSDDVSVFMDDDALQSLEDFMQSLSSASTTRSVHQ